MISETKSVNEYILHFVKKTIFVTCKASGQKNRINEERSLRRRFQNLFIKNEF